MSTSIVTQSPVWRWTVRSGIVALLVLLLVLSPLCGCARERGKAEPVEDVQLQTATDTPTIVSPTATIAPEPSQTPSMLSSPALIGIIDLGGPALHGRQPLALALSGAFVYVANEATDNLSVIRDGRVQNVLPLQPGPYHAAYGADAERAYLSAEQAQVIYVLEAGEIANVWPLAFAPTALALADETLWIGGADGTIARLDAISGHLVSTDAPLDDGMIVDLLSPGGDYVLAATFTQIHLYSRADARIIVSQPYPGYRTMAAGDDAIYVCAYDRDTDTTIVDELNGTSLLLQNRLTVPDDTVALAVDATTNRLVAAGNITNQISLYDLTSGDLLATTGAGLSPQQLVYDPASQLIYASFFESDTVAAFESETLRLEQTVPLTLRVTALLASESSEMLYVGLNDGTVRALGPQSDATLLAGAGYPAALAELPDGAGLAVLDKSRKELALYDTDMQRTQLVSAGGAARGLYLDTTSDSLFANGTRLALSTGSTDEIRFSAGQPDGGPVQVVRDTTQDVLYAVALNGLAGSNGGYVVYRQDGDQWADTRVPGRLSVLDIVFDQATDRFFATNGHMGTYGVQVFDTRLGQEIHYVTLEAPPVALLLSSQFSHLWVATAVAASAGTPAHTLVTAYDTRVFAPVASVRINDTIALATVDRDSGRLHLAAASGAIIYTLQDTPLPRPKTAVEPVLAPAQTSTAPAEVIPVESASPPVATATLAPTPSKIASPLPTYTLAPTATTALRCEIPVQTDLQAAWESAASELGCPTSAAMRDDWGWQPFEGGTAYWRRDTRQIIMALSSGTILPFEDRWLEGMPDQSCEANAPEGLWQPIRGFGLVWCEQPGVRDALGWALEPEAVFQSTYQLFSRGILFTGNGHGVIWLDNQGTWKELVQ